MRNARKRDQIETNAVENVLQPSVFFFLIHSEYVGIIENGHFFLRRIQLCFHCSWSVWGSEFRIVIYRVLLPIKVWIVSLFFLRTFKVRYDFFLNIFNQAKCNAYSAISMIKMIVYEWLFRKFYGEIWYQFSHCAKYTHVNGLNRDTSEPVSILGHFAWISLPHRLSINLTWMRWSLSQRSPKWNSLYFNYSNHGQDDWNGMWLCIIIGVHCAIQDVRKPSQSRCCWIWLNNSLNYV